MIIIAILIIYIVFIVIKHTDTYYEKFELNNEAIQNISSLVQNGKLTVTNLEATGNVTANNVWTNVCKLNNVTVPTFNSTTLGSTKANLKLLSSDSGTFNGGITSSGLLQNVGEVDIANGAMYVTEWSGCAPSDALIDYPLGTVRYGGAWDNGTPFIGAKYKSWEIAGHGTDRYKSKILTFSDRNTTGFPNCTYGKVM